MKNLKTYQNNGIEYTYSVNARGWTFKIPAIKYEFIAHFRGGAEIAHKICNILSGAVKRCGEIDGLARRNIDLIIKKYSGKI